jgi:hypothetical protein
LPNSVVLAPIFSSSSSVMLAPMWSTSSGTSTDTAPCALAP